MMKRYNLKEGTLLAAEMREDGILLYPVVALPVESYTPQRKAEFLLNNAVTPEDYDWAVKEVRKLGLDPEKIPHERPESR